MYIVYRYTNEYYAATCAYGKLIRNETMWSWLLLSKLNRRSLVFIARITSVRFLREKIVDKKKKTTTSGKRGNH